MHVTQTFGTLILINSVAFGQTIAPPKYEVSSIKPPADSDFQYRFNIEPDGMLYATGITLRRLMMTAYQIQGFRLVGGPGWVSNRRWDVQAKPSRAASDKQIWPMLRGLLEDRFQLRVHSETRNMPVYELTIGPHGSKLQTVDGSNIKLDIRTGNGLIRFTKATAATFASQLSYALARPVIDKRASRANSVSISNGPRYPARMADPQPPACRPELRNSPLQPPMGHRSLQLSSSNSGSA
jgi:hypothetical protein